MDYVSQKSLRAFILSYLFAAAQTDKAGRSIDEIKSIIVKTIGLRRVELGIEELEGDELVEDISPNRSAERRAGDECASKCRSRWSAHNYHKKDVSSKINNIKTNYHNET